MSVEVVALGGGILFLLVAIVGGGFSIREIAMPTVPNWARLVSAVFGVLLLLPFMLFTFGGRVGGDTTLSTKNDLERQPSGQVRSGIEIDTEHATTGDQIRLMGLAASVRNNPPLAGDTITVSYSLTNVGNDPMRLGYTFVGARNPSKNNRDSEDINEGKVLAPGETIQAEGRVFLDSAGTWELWPCYTLTGGQFCPDKWKAFNVIVK